MQCFKQFPTLIFLYFVLYLTVGCGSDKPNQPIEKTIDTIAFYVSDTLADSNDDPTIPTPDNFMVSIERTHRTTQGQYESIDINMHNSSRENLSIGGYIFLVRFDASALSFQGADMGQFLNDCGWEYFSYRYSAIVDSSSFRTLLIIAAAEVIDGQDNHPNCFTDSGSVSNQLATLNFLVTNDRTYECAFIPIQFFWDDCGVNAITDVSRSKVFLNNHIFNYEDTSKIDYSVNLADNVHFPTYYGANITCDTMSWHDSIRIIDFVNGGIEIVCADPIESRGDMNLNKIVNETSDVVLYANYFLYGLSVFTVNTEGQIAISDINADGTTLTVADLVYLIRVIIGNALPFPNDIPVQNITPVYPIVTRIIKDGTLNVNKEMGAMSIVIEGDVAYELLDTTMTIRSNFDGTNTHILVYSLKGNSFNGDFLKVLGNIVSIEFGSAEGAMVVLSN